MTDPLPRATQSSTQPFAEVLGTDGAEMEREASGGVQDFVLPPTDVGEVFILREMPQDQVVATLNRLQAIADAAREWRRLEAPYWASPVSNLNNMIVWPAPRLD